MKGILLRNMHSTHEENDTDCVLCWRGLNSYMTSWHLYKWDIRDIVLPSIEEAGIMSAEFLNLNLPVDDLDYHIAF